MNKALLSTDFREVWKQYEAGVSYKLAIDLYDNVEKCDAFYRGDQWRGVNAPDIDRPVINIIKRIESYKTSIIVSDDIGYQIDAEEDQIELRDALCKAIDGVLEDNDSTSMNREMLRDAAINGDCCLVGWFDAEAETGQQAKGRIRLESIENINVQFANPYTPDVQEQPYIIIAKRCFLDSVREEAAENGMDPENIHANDDYKQGETGTTNSLTTVLTKFFKKNGKVWFSKTCRDGMVKEATETAMTLYPIAWMNWTKRRSSMHGIGDVEEVIPNQITINKLMALYVRSVQMTAFPKVIFDASRIREWSNRVGAAIKSYGAVGNDIANVLRGADTSYQVADVIERMIAMTKDCMGASDAALGNVKAENTSAIVAVQQACAYPLQLQKNAFKAFVEQYIRFIADMIAAYYGIRDMKVCCTAEEQEAGMGENKRESFDFAGVRPLLINMKVNVGDSAYWSVLSQSQTLDNLLANGILTDTKLYLESMPGDSIPNREAIIKSVEQRQAAEQQAQQMPQGVAPEMQIDTGARQPNQVQEAYAQPALR